MTRKNRIKIITNILNSNGFNLDLVFESKQTFGYFDKKHGVFIGFDGPDAYSDVKCVNDYVKFLTELADQYEIKIQVSFPYFIRLSLDILDKSMTLSGIQTDVPIEEMFMDDLDIFESSNTPHGFIKGDVLPGSFVHMGLEKFETDLCVIYLEEAPEIVQSMEKLLDDDHGNALLVYPTGNINDPLIILSDPAFWGRINDDNETIDLIESYNMNLHMLHEKGVDSFESRVNYFMSVAEENGLFDDSDED
jgi:hypothetical protein